MSVSGVGSNFSYIYNSMTGKLSTKDGSADEFVDYFNGDLAAEESKELNGFDAKKKGDIESMIFWFTEGAKSGIAKDIFNNRNGYEYEIRETIECMKKGEKECPYMKHEDTLEVLRIMDEFRSEWGIHYPDE